LAPLLLKVVNDFLDDFAEFFVNLHRIIAVNARDQVGALTDVDLVFVTPFHPAMVFVDWLHFWTTLLLDYLDCVLNLLLLVLLGVVAVPTAQRHGTGVIYMGEFSMGTFAAAGDLRETGVAENLHQFADFSGHVLNPLYLWQLGLGDAR
jgi:hypothetical protein